MMLRLLIVGLFLLHTSGVYAAVEQKTVTSSLPPPSLNKVVAKKIVICGDANLALTFYWIATEEGFDLALTYYSPHFLYGDCSLVQVNIPLSTWTSCARLSKDECGMVPVLLSSGSKKFGAVVAE